jgi:uridylate kinase
MGGSVFSEKPDLNRLKGFANVLSRLHEKGNRIVVVTGGGNCARRYIEVARALGSNEAICDLIGIYSSRLNANLLIVALGDLAYPDVPTSIERMRVCVTSERIVVMGGLQPAQSTDAVASIVAEAISSDRFVKVTNAPGVCTKDPRKYPDAKKLDEIEVEAFLRLVSESSISAGAYELMDPVAIRVVQRSKLRTWIVSGDDPANIVRAVNEEKVGTRITF